MGIINWGWSIERRMFNFFLYLFQIRHCHASQGFTVGPNIQYETWKDVVEHSVRNPEIVLQALQDRERFDLVREWIHVYGYPSQLREVGMSDIIRPTR